MSNITPAPWQVSQPDANTYEVMSSHGCGLVCTVHGTGDEVKANASLLAAAPKLASALSAAKNALIDLYEEAYRDDESDNYITAAIDHAISALAKARGEDNE